MQVINIQNAWRRVVSEAWRLLPGHDSFQELAGHRCTQIVLSDSHFKLARNGGASLPMEQLVFTHEAEEPDSICGILRNREAVIVSIGIECCYSRLLKLPMTAYSRIGAILDLDLARTTPFAPESVYSAWINHGHSNDGINLDIQHLVIRKDIVTRILETIERAGAKPLSLIVRDASGNALPVAISPGGQPFGSDTYKKWGKTTTISAALMAIGLVALGGAMWERQSRTEAAIADSLASVQADAADVQKRLDTIKAQSAEISALLDRRTKSSGRAAIIEELSRVLPDDAYLDGFSIETGRLVADGQAAAPEALIAILEASPLYQKVALNAPVYRNPGERNSRFSIRLETESAPAEVSK